MDLWTILGDIVVLLAGTLLLGGPGSIHAVHSEHEIEPFKTSQTDAATG